MAEKITIMNLNVDLHCSKCYKKVKKLLSKFPQIGDQVYDEKNNIVTIKVTCCSPEKIRDKLCYKGCGTIKTIEILEPPKPPVKPKPDLQKPKGPEKPKELPKEPEKPKAEPEKPKEKPAEAPPAKAEAAPKVVEAPPAKAEAPPKVVEAPPAKAEAPPKVMGAPPAGAEAPPKVMEAPPAKAEAAPKVVEAAPAMAVPIGMCCVPTFYEGYGGGGMPCYEGYYGRPVYDSYGGGGPCYVSHCDEYIVCQDNTQQSCTIM